jgi:hypothetical protein
MNIFAVYLIFVSITSPSIQNESMASSSTPPIKNKRCPHNPNTYGFMIHEPFSLWNKTFFRSSSKNTK